MMNCICKIKINGGFGTGFFCKIPFMNSSMKVLMTNCHVLDNIIYIQNKELSLFINDDKEVKNIKIELDRKTYFNKKYDIAIIELKESDNIYNFLELDDNLFKNETKIYYKDISVYILQYPLGNKSSVSYGKLIDIDNYEIKHICNTMQGSSGSPILNLSNNKVIGIHKQSSIKYNFNFGTCLKFPLNDFYLKNDKKKSNLNVNKNNNSPNESNSNMKTNLVMTDLFNDMKNLLKPGSGIKIMFNTTSGHIFSLGVNYGTTIDQLLKYYLKRMNRAELIEKDNKINFLFNKARLKFGDRTPIETCFWGVRNPFVLVKLIDFSFDGNWCNWTKEEEERINKEIEEKELEIQYLNEKEITVKFNKKGSIIKIKLSDEYMVAELIDEYFKKTNASNGKFTFNGQILSPTDPSSLYEIGLYDNSEIIVN